MITKEQSDAIVASLPGEKITADAIKARIVEVKFHKLGPTLTHCAIHMDNGFIATGESACVDPANYNRDVGERLAYDQAFNKLWPLFGFMLAEARHVRRMMAP